MSTTPMMRKYVIPVFTANTAALVVVAGSYLAYSRLLTASQFGMYSVALAVGSFVTLVLDGGIKASIIKSAQAPTQEQESLLLQVMLAFAGILLIALFATRGVVSEVSPSIRGEADFIVSYGSVLLVSYPWISLPTAGLERRLEYTRLAWIESIGLLLERAVPAVLLVLTAQELYSFVWSLALGRLCRAIALAYCHRVTLGSWGGKNFRSVIAFLREGIWYQLGSASASLRDNLHVLILGPIYGSAWVGYYAWGLQLCMIASQIFVQVSARISLPITSQTTEFVDRWRLTIRQVGLLAAVTAPILAAALIVAPVANHEAFGDKWRTAIALLPFLFARMLPGSATAPVGVLVFVDAGAKQYAVALWRWTAFEVSAGLLCIGLLGPGGLAISYCIGAWAGIYALVGRLGRSTWRLFSTVAMTIIGRPSLWAAALLTCLVMGRTFLSHDPLASVPPLLIAVPAIGVIVISYSLDSDLRRALISGRS